MNLILVKLRRPAPIPNVSASFLLGEAHLSGVTDKGDVYLKHPVNLYEVISIMGAEPSGILSRGKPQETRVNINYTQAGCELITPAEKYRVFGSDIQGIREIGYEEASELVQKLRKDYEATVRSITSRLYVPKNTGLGLQQRGEA